MTTHEMAMTHTLCLLPDGSIGALSADQKYVVCVVLPGAARPEWLNLMRASDHMYRTIDHTAGVLDSVIEVLEQVGADQLVSPMVETVAALRTAQDIAREGVEVVSARFTRPPEPPKRKKWWFGEK